ncbi:MAG: hypothetical protein M3Q63_03830 [bacterium]|nr:hypothetical protein [bacterium]
MERNITEILEDLNRLNPDFKVNDKDLRKMIAEIMALKPETRFDESFATRLRSELVDKKSIFAPLSPYIAQVKAFTQNAVESKYFSYFDTKLFTGAAGALIAILLVAPLTYVLTKKNIEQSPEAMVKNISSGLSLKQQINSKEGNAFGKLAYITPQPASVSANESVQDSGLAKTSGMRSMSLQAPSESSTAVIAYTGDKIALTETEGKVYKRVKGIDAGKQLANFLKNANFDVVNVGKFNNLSLENLQLSEDSAYGHTLSINFNDGVININQNSQWDTDGEGKTLTAGDILEDAKLIEIANSYVNDHGIDVSGYGKSQVVGKQNGIIPDALYVTYPLIIDGLEVYEESGVVYGLQVVIDLRNKKVSAVNNLTSQLYESSVYAMETDFAKVIRAATGTSATNTGAAGEISTPHKVLMRYATDINNELYIPAMLFPVKGKGGSITGTVVIPLVKDALDKISVKGIELDPEPVDVGTTTSTTTPIIDEPKIIPPVVEETKKFLSQKLQVDPAAIMLDSFISEEWPNSCLGTPVADEVCGQAIVPGYTVKLSVATSSYEFRTDVAGKIIREIKS